MRWFSFLLGSLLLLTLAPSLASAAPPSPQSARTRRAPDVQPDPTSPFVRDARAEVILGHVGLAVSRTRRRVEASRAAGDVSRVTCITERLGRLAALEQKARSRRSDLRAAALDDAATSDAPWIDLLAFEVEAQKIENEARTCVGQENVFVVDGLNVGTVDVGSSSTGVTLTREFQSVIMVAPGAAADSFTSGLASAFRSIRGPSSKNAAAPQLTQAAPPPPPLPSGPATPATAPTTSPFKRDAAHDTSMLLRSAQITLAVYEVEKKMDAVEATARELGGYLALRGDREISVRVPRERFDEALKGIEKLGDVIHKSVAAEDVTDQYVDLELRLRNAHAVRGRLEKLLESASVRDAVEIHKELAKVTEEIERLEGKLKLLRDRIAFSTITISFERTEPQKVRTQQALLPFPWMRTMGLAPLLQVSR